MSWWPLPTLKSSMRSRVTTAHAVSKPLVCWLENAQFVAQVSHVQQFEAPVFHRYLLIRCSYSMHRCLELEIWRFSWQWQTDRQTKPIALPLAHVHGVKSMHSTSLHLLVVDRLCEQYSRASIGMYFIYFLVLPSLLHSLISRYFDRWPS